MKQLLLIAAAFVMVTSCGGGDTKKEESTTPKVESRDTKGLKIAYYDQDTVAKYFVYFREQDSIMTKKQLIFQGELTKRQKALEDYVRMQDQNNQKGLLSQMDLMKVQQNIETRQAALYQYQESEGMKLEQERMEMMDALSAKMKTFSEDFCEENNIDILLIYAPGGQINYISSKMDVTNEFATYLNQRQDELISGKGEE